MLECRDEIMYLAKQTKMDNKQIAQKVGCSERSVRRYAGEWKSRMQKKHTNHDLLGEERKAFIMYDPHIPYHSKPVYEVAMNYARNWNPDDVIIGGDFMDFKDVSTWKDDPRRMTFKQEVDIGRAMLVQLREFFPTQRMFYIEGNHEHRLARYMWLKAPELCRFPEMAFEKLMDLEPLGIEYVSNIERMNNGLLPFKLGKLFVLHGHEVNMSFTGVNLARTLYLKTHVNVVFGHHHQSQHFIFKKLDNTHEGAWMVGGLCKLSESYQPITNWVHGFCTLKYNPVTGYFKIRNKMIIEGQVL